MATLIKLYPAAEYFGERGKILVNLKKFRSAITDFNEALALEPRNNEYLAMRGYCFGMLSDYSKADLDFLSSKLVDDSNGKLYQYIGEIELKKGNIDKACENFKLADKMGVRDNGFLASCKND